MLGKIQKNAFWSRLLHSRSQGVSLLDRHDIKNKCTSCPLCAQYASQAPTEPMLRHDIPDYPWSVVSQHILRWEGKWHLVTTCYYSDWVEIDVLPNTLTETVVQLTKAHFARFGIPERLITDNGP